MSGHLRSRLETISSRRAPRSEWPWLEHAPPLGTPTVAHVHAARDADEQVARVWEWAPDVWGAWAPHHAIVRDWVDA